MLKLEKAFLGASTYSFNADGIVISETVYHEKVFEGWHCHEHHHLSFIVQGGNREQRRNRELDARPGTVLLYNSGELHRNINTRHPSKNINLEIEAAFLDQHQLSFSAAMNDPGLKLAVIKSWQESRINDAGSIPSIQASLLQALGGAIPGKKPGSTPPWIGELRALLHDCWNEPLSLRQLAAVIHVHPVTISKYFPRYFHCTLGEYMRKVKIEKALALIRQTQHPLTNIAYECGFSDQSHFTRTFKACTGMLPGEYQKL